MKHQVHASNLVETPEGLICAFFRGTREGENDVGIYLTRNVKGDSVTNSRRIADGNGKPCWNPVLFQVEPRQLLLWFQVGIFQKWTGMMKRSTDNGKTWSEADPLPDRFLGPIRNKPILLPDGRLLCPSSTEVPDWRIHFELYDDAYGSWQKIEVHHQDGFDSIQPTLLLWPDGHIQALCRTCNGVIATCRSTDGGWTWTPLVDAGLPNPNSAIDAIMLRDGRALLVYNHAGLYEHQRRLRSMKPSGPRTPLNVAISEDGKSWQQIATLEDDRTPSEMGRPPEFSYPSVIQTQDGKVHVTYTWRRQRIAHKIIEV